MSVRHSRLRALRLWLILRILGGYFDNHRRCGCCDYHPATRGMTQLGLHPVSRFGPTFHLIPCDSCGTMLQKFLASK